MNLEEYLAEMHRRAARHMSSRSAAVAGAAKRAKVLLQTAGRHLLPLVSERQAAEALIEASALLADLDGRRARAARERRAEQLARARPPVRRKVSDEALLAAQGRGGGCRQVAHRLGVDPSTVSRRLRALPPVTGCNAEAEP